MQPLLQCRRLSHSVGTKPLFTEINLHIRTGDKIGLVGHNGSGKSTLLSILNGTVEPDEGEISRNNSLQLETVEQFIDGKLLELSMLDALMAKLPSESQITDGYKAEQLLFDLGFAEREFNHHVKDLSGGQQNRLMFARALINEPNLILFDEPTNHLDLKTLLLFEQYLQELSAAFLLISHDREFLDAVTDRTVFLRDERLYFFELPFSLAKSELEEQDKAAMDAREQEEKNIRRLEASAKRISAWSRAHESEKLARKAKSMEKRVDKLKQNKTFTTRGSGLKLSLDVEGSQANRMLGIDQRSVTAPDGSILFEIEDFAIRPGDAVALLGHNGAGKTTLINQIMSHYRSQPDGPDFKFNPQCSVGYYDQELSLLDPAQTLTSALRDACGGADATLKSALIRAGFPHRDLDKSVSVLSGGEKARLMFLIIKLNRPNFLILDEPTNHIDIQGKEELEEQILSANATVLITSHDRRFVETIATRFVLIAEGKLIEIETPELFYQATSLGKEIEQSASEHQSELNSTSEVDTQKDILERIIELEGLLEADRARKPKFQKPKLQTQWESELNQLNEQL